MGVLKHSSMLLPSSQYCLWFYTTFPPSILPLLKYVKCNVITFVINVINPIAHPTWLSYVVVHTTPRTQVLSCANREATLVLLWQLPKGRVAFLLTCSFPAKPFESLHLFLKEASSSDPRFPMLIPGIHSLLSQDCLVKWILITANSNFSEKVASGNICNSPYFSRKYVLLLKRCFPFSTKLQVFLSSMWVVYYFFSRL